jgi:rhodanese-related sulfurtransferase
MEPKRITAEEVKKRLDAGEAITFLDSRADDSWRTAELQLPKSIRVPPDAVEAHLDQIPRRGLIVPYCTWPQEHSSARVAQMLLQRGWTNVRPLIGGFDAWRTADYPIEAKPTRTQSVAEVAANVRDAEGDSDAK